jgi:peptidoglycan/xylan/chitin deacetylase (PgdA/CDA1 family)
MTISKFYISLFLSLPLVLLSILENQFLIAFMVITFESILIGFGVARLHLNFFGKSLISLSDKDQIALTFDDGPDPNLTPQILSLLKKEGIKCTFFLISQKVEAYPAVVEQIFDAGHSIGSHDLSHSWRTNLRFTEKMVEEIGESCKIIEAITKKRVKLYRPPVGLSNPHLFSALKKLNLTCVGWDIWAGEGGNRFLEPIKKIPLLSEKKGTIILLHDCENRAEFSTTLLNSVEKLIHKLKSSGREFVTLD